MFEIFLALFPLALGNGRLACTNFEALATVGASENLVGAITRFTATLGALVLQLTRSYLLGHLVLFNDVHGLNFLHCKLFW